MTIPINGECFAILRQFPSVEAMQESHRDPTDSATFDEASLLGAFVLDGKGGGHPIKWKGIQNWKPEHGPIWIHLDRKAADAQRWLRRHSGLDHLACEALLAEETRPRAQAHGDGLLAILRGVNLNPGETPDDMISVRLWVEPHRIISLRAPKLMALSDVRESLVAGTGPRSTGELLTAIVHRLTERMGPVVANLDSLLDDFEEQVLERPELRLQHSLANIRRQAIALRRYIAPQRDAIQQVQTLNHSSLNEADRLHLRENADRTIRYLEDLEALRERATVVQEEIAMHTSEQMNRRMYTLSLVAGIFLPLGFVTGLLGINVGGMPGVDSPDAFAIVCGLLSGLALLSLWVLRRMKFF